MTTLASMRTLVRQLLDDESDDTEELRYSDGEIDFALEAGLEAVVIQYAPQGNRLDQTAEVTTTDGSASLAAYKPVLIKSVEYKSGSFYAPLGASDGNAPSAEGVNATLRVTYVGLPDFPATAETELTYGSGASVGLKSFDRLVAIRAALDLLPKDAERNAPLEAQEQRAWQTVLQTASIPRGREMVLSSGGAWSETSYSVGPASRYRWAFVAGTQALKLVL